MEGLKRERGDLALIGEAKAQRVELAMQLQEVEQCLANQVKQLKMVWSMGVEQVVELDLMRTYTSKLEV